MMDSVCCDTGREKTVPHGSHMGNSIDGCLQIDPNVVSNSVNTTGESDGDTLSNGVSPIESFQTPSWPKSPVFSDAVEDFAPGGLDIHLNPSASNKASTDDYMKRHATEDKLEKTVVFSASTALEPKNEPSSSRSPLESKNEPSSSRSPLEPKNDPSSSSRSPTFVPNLTPSRGSPRHPLSRQISDSWILAHESLRNSSSERGPSFVLSACSNDMTLGSHGGSSDGWSMGRSFDNENTNSIPERIRSDDMHFSPPLDSRSCELCLKNLEDVSPFICGTDIVSVLVCGHLYHAEYLEGVTPDARKFDLRCPICSSTGTLSWTKFLRRSFSRIRYEDCDRFMVSRHGGRGSKMAASSSTSVSFTKPFLRRRFTFGGRASRTLWSTTLRTGRASGQGTSRNKSICR